MERKAVLYKHGHHCPAQKKEKKKIRNRVLSLHCIIAASAAAAAAVIRRRGKKMYEERNMNIQRAGKK